MKKILSLFTFFLLAVVSIHGQTFLTSLNRTKYVHTFTITAGSTNNAVATFYLIGAGGGAAGNDGNKGGGGGASGGYVRGSVTVPAGTSQTFRITLGTGGAGRSALTTQSGGQGGNTTLESINPSTQLPTGVVNVIAIGGAGGALSSTVSNTGRNNQTTGLSSPASNIGNPGSWSNGASGSAGGSVNLTGETAFLSGNSQSFNGGNGGGTNVAGNSGSTGGGGGSAGKANGADLAGGNGGDGFARIDLAGNGATLPVTFGAIKATEKGAGVQIDWTSYSEQNLANYQIERSADGVNFTSVGEVAPRNAAETQYGFFDALPLSGTSFYRIRNNDIDGKSGLSNIVKINLNKNIKTISVYPNPIRGNRVSFQTSDLTKGTYNVEVINAFGARVFQQSVNHAGGAINQSLSLPTLQSGSYTLRINGTATASTHKITILQ